MFELGELFSFTLLCVLLFCSSNKCPETGTSLCPFVNCPVSGHFCSQSRTPRKVLILRVLPASCSTNWNLENLTSKRMNSQKTALKCSVCNSDSNVGFSGAVQSCEACKKFYERSIRENRYPGFSCRMHKNCNVDGPENRSSCQYCRFQKCLKSGMRSVPEQNGQNSVVTEGIKLVQTTKCAICGSESNGIHFGLITCEACKVRDIALSRFLSRAQLNLVFVLLSRPFSDVPFPKKSTRSTRACGKSANQATDVR